LLDAHGIEHDSFLQLPAKMQRDEVERLRYTSRAQKNEQLLQAHSKENPVEALKSYSSVQISNFISSVKEKQKQELSAREALIKMSLESDPL